MTDICPYCKERSMALARRYAAKTCGHATCKQKHKWARHEALRNTKKQWAVKKNLSLTFFFEEVKEPPADWPSVEVYHIAFTAAARKAGWLEA